MVWPRENVARNRTVALSNNVTNIGQNNPYNMNHQSGNAAQIEGCFYYGALNDKTYPWLAESHEYNDDATVCTVYMRKGAMWNDGTPLTAKDLAFTLNTLRDFAPVMRDSGLVANSVENAEALDDYTVKITLTETNWRFHFTILTFRFDRGMYLLPEHVYNQFESGEELLEYTAWDPENGEYGVHSGPYLLVRTEEAYKELHLRYEWWAVDIGLADRMPWPEAITNIPYPGEEVAAQLLINDELDTCLDMRPATIETMLDQASDHIITYSGLNKPYGYVDWWPISVYPNNNEPPYDDVRVRWALAYAIDQQGVVDVGWDGAGFITTTPFPGYPGLKNYVEAPSFQEVFNQYNPTEYDLDKVDELMTDAGFEKNADGFWAKDGETFDCDIWAGVPLFGDIAPITAEYLRQAGFPSNHVTPPDVWAGKSDGRAMLHLFGHGGSVKEPWYTLNMYHSQWWTPTGENCGQNRPRWKNEEYDGYVEEMSRTSPDDTEKMQELFDKAMEIWYRELPEVPLVEWTHRTPHNTTYWTQWPNFDDQYNSSFWHLTFPLTLWRLEPTT
jgi:peptide/nickel transport system substrate-binding protein